MKNLDKVPSRKAVAGTGGERGLRTLGSLWTGVLEDMGYFWSSIDLPGKKRRKTMSYTTEYCIVLTTCETTDEAHKLASGLIKERLAACVQLSAITSYYEWNSKLTTGHQQLLFIKTRTSLYKRIESFITGHHSYEVPEIVQIPIRQGLTGYLNWIDEVCGQ